MQGGDYGLSFCCGVIAAMFGLGSLYAFDVTDADDWKMLELSLLLSGGAAVLLVLLGNALGDLMLWGLVELVFE